MLEMVKTLVFSLNYGKAAVHCHGGIDRTGKSNSFVLNKRFQKKTISEIYENQITQCY